MANQPTFEDRLAGATVGAVPDEASIPIQLLVEIEDRLFQVLELDVWERCVYYHLLRQSNGGSSPAVIALARAARATGMSEDKIRRTIRSMAVKGCVRIDERGKNGHVVQILLPSEIDRVRESGGAEQVLNIEALDFYTDRRYAALIHKRDNRACFYCGRSIGADAFVLDHVIPVVLGGGNSHRNIVTSCHECNSIKQAEPADEFMRRLYRKGVLSQADLASTLERLAKLQGGHLPILIEGFIE